MHNRLLKKRQLAFVEALETNGGAAFESLRQRFSAPCIEAGD